MRGRQKEEVFVNNQENSLFMLLKVWMLVDKSNNESNCLYFTGKCICITKGIKLTKHNRCYPCQQKAVKNKKD